MSQEMLEEVRDVLTRPKLQQQFPRLTVERVETLLQNLLDKAEMVDDVPTVFRYERDPEDEPYINLALAAGAAYIVSRDNDLLDLMDANRSEGHDFRARFPELTILNPVAFLRAITPQPLSENAEETERASELEP